MKSVLFLFVLLIFTACNGYIGHDEPVEAPAPKPQQTATPTPAPLPEKIDAELQNEIQKIAEQAEGTVGVGAVMLETGDAVWLERHGQFPMQSVYKVPISMTVLKMVEEGRVKIDQAVVITPDDFPRHGFSSTIRNQNPAGTVLPVGDIIRYSIAESDGTATDVLLEIAGGPAAVDRYVKSLGIEEMHIRSTIKDISKDWETQYQNWCSPHAAIELLKVINDGRSLGPQSTNLLFNVMTETETGRRRLKRGLPKEAQLAHKTGTGGTKDGITGATNDFGIITAPDGRKILIAVLIRDSRAQTWLREKTMADIARAVYTKWILMR